MNRDGYRELVIFWTGTLLGQLVVQQIVVQGATDYIMQCRGCACMVSSDSRCVSAVCACSPVEVC